MQLFTSYQYMLIEVANNYGLDKETYETRLDWVKNNMDNLEELTVNAEEYYLYKKAVKNLRDVQEGKPTGALVRFDAVCSGIQLLSVLTRCQSGCKATGVINTGKRPNAYLQVQRTMQELLGEAIEIDYKAIKESVMTSCYGSRAVPKKHFSGDRLDAFYAACRTVAPGAFNLLPVLQNTWNPNTLVHEWDMPDGYHVYIPVMETDTVELNLANLDGFGMSTLVTKNVTKDFGVANIANITHSIDAYVLRSLIRYCNYDKEHVTHMANIIEAELIERSLNGKHIDTCETKERMAKLNLVDISIINNLDVSKTSDVLLKVLSKDLNSMLEHKPFEVVPVHDCFGCSPVNMNTLRKWYNEILARLSNSNLLADIISQLVGSEVSLKVFPEDISELIRESDYAIN